MASVFEHNAYFPAVVTCECGKRVRPTHRHSPPNYDPELIYCPFCGKELPMKTEVASNADRIRAMSDEEMAELPWEYDFQCYMCPNKPLCDDGYKTCKELWLDWLKSPAEGTE